MRNLCMLFLLLLLALGCGGGGGGSPQSSRFVGRVLDVRTGGPTNPASSVQAANRSTFTEISDGSFSLPVPSGTSSILIDTLGNGYGVFVFGVPPASGTSDVGDLWVGPERVTLTGTVRNAVTDAPVVGATVRFAGRTGTTNAQGTFFLNDVAYSSETQTAFWGIAGFISANGFLSTEFSAQPNVAISGVVTVDDILLSPVSSPNPPPLPFNLWGRVTPAADAPGTIATLKLNGNAVRIYNVGSDGIYRFWVSPGTYSIDFEKGAKSANVASVTITAPNEVVQRDVTLQ